MAYKDIPIGKNPPREVNAFIENSVGGIPVKYEMNKASGALFVDRFLHTSMHYPGNYGFIPHTLSDDGDPVDILVIGDIPVASGAVLPARPIGVLLMEDEQGKDEKIIAVPAARLNPDVKNINSYKDLPESLRDKIKHFFKHYKDLEKGKYVKNLRWAGPQKAYKLINEGIVREQQQNKKPPSPGASLKGPTV